MVFQQAIFFFASAIQAFHLKDTNFQASPTLVNDAGFSLEGKYFSSKFLHFCFDGTVFFVKKEGALKRNSLIFCLDDAGFSPNLR